LDGFALNNEYLFGDGLSSNLEFCCKFALGVEKNTKRGAGLLGF